MSSIFRQAYEIITSKTVEEMTEEETKLVATATTFAANELPKVYPKEMTIKEMTISEGLLILARMTENNNLKERRLKMGKEQFIRDAVGLFSKASTTKEVAFLNGFLTGLGAHLACPTPNWQLMEKFPDTIDAEKHIRDIFEGIHKDDIEITLRLLVEYKRSPIGEGKMKEVK